MQNTRLAAICRNFGINPDDVEIYHFPLVTKVTTSARIMRKKASSVKAVFGVLDSVGMGRGGNAVAAEDTIRMFRALHSIGIPFGAVDHISKEGKKSKTDDVDPYGSVYTMNASRLAWYFSRSFDADLDTISIYAKNTKANHVRLQKPRRIHTKYHNDEYGIPERISIEVSDDFGMVRESVPIHARMMMLLGQGTLTVEELADELGVERNRIDTALARDKKNDRPTFGKDKLCKPMRICLTDGLTDGVDRRDKNDES